MMVSGIRRAVRQERYPARSGLSVHAALAVKYRLVSVLSRLEVGYIMLALAPDLNG